MLASGVCRWSIPKATLACCHSRDWISAPPPLKTLSSSCSRKPPREPRLLGRSGELDPGGPPLPSTMVGNSASYEVGKSYTPVSGVGTSSLSSCTTDELFLLFSDSKLAGDLAPNWWRGEHVEMTTSMVIHDGTHVLESGGVVRWEVRGSCSTEQ